MQIQGILGACRAFGLKWHQLWTGGEEQELATFPRVQVWPTVCKTSTSGANQQWKATAGTVDCKMVYVRGARFEPEAACAARF